MTLLATFAGLGLLGLLICKAVRRLGDLLARIAPETDPDRQWPS